MEIFSGLCALAPPLKTRGICGEIREVVGSFPTLRVQVPNNHILTQTSTIITIT